MGLFRSLLKLLNGLIDLWKSSKSWRRNRKLDKESNDARNEVAERDSGAVSSRVDELRKRFARNQGK